MHRVTYAAAATDLVKTPSATPPNSRLITLFDGSHLMHQKSKPLASLTQSLAPGINLHAVGPARRGCCSILARVRDTFFVRWSCWRMDMQIAPTLWAASPACAPKNKPRLADFPHDTPARSTPLRFHTHMHIQRLICLCFRPPRLRLIPENQRYLLCTQCCILY